MKNRQVDVDGEQKLMAFLLKIHSDDLDAVKVFQKIELSSKMCLGLVQNKKMDAPLFYEQIALECAEEAVYAFNRLRIKQGKPIMRCDLAN